MPRTPKRVLLISSAVFASVDVFQTYCMNSVLPVVYDWQAPTNMLDLIQVVADALAAAGCSVARHQISSIGLMYHTTEPNTVKLFAHDHARSTAKVDDAQAADFVDFRDFVRVLRVVYGIEDLDIISCSVVPRSTATVLNVIGAALGVRINAATQREGDGDGGTWMLQEGGVDTVGRYFKPKIRKSGIVLDNIIDRLISFYTQPLDHWGPQTYLNPMQDPWLNTDGNWCTWKGVKPASQPTPIQYSGQRPTFTDPFYSTHLSYYLTKRPPYDPKNPQHFIMGGVKWTNDGPPCPDNLKLALHTTKTQDIKISICGGFLKNISPFKEFDSGAYTFMDPIVLSKYDFSDKDSWITIKTAALRFLTDAKANWDSTNGLIWTASMNCPKDDSTNKNACIYQCTQLTDSPIYFTLGTNNTAITFQYTQYKFKGESIDSVYSKTKYLLKDIKDCIVKYLDKNFPSTIKGTETYVSQNNIMTKIDDLKYMINKDNSYIFQSITSNKNNSVNTIDVFDLHSTTTKGNISSAQVIITVQYNSKNGIDFEDICYLLFTMRKNRDAVISADSD